MGDTPEEREARQRLQRKIGDHVSATVRQYRMNMGLSQRQLALIVSGKSHQGTIGNIERNRQGVDLSTMVRLTKARGLTFTIRIANGEIEIE